MIKFIKDVWIVVLLDFLMLTLKNVWINVKDQQIKLLQIMVVQICAQMVNIYLNKLKL